MGYATYKVILVLAKARQDMKIPAPSLRRSFQDSDAVWRHEKLRRMALFTVAERFASPIIPESTFASDDILDGVHQVGRSIKRPCLVGGDRN